MSKQSQYEVMRRLAGGRMIYADKLVWRARLRLTKGRSRPPSH